MGDRNFIDMSFDEIFPETKPDLPSSSLKDKKENGQSAEYEETEYGTDISYLNEMYGNAGNDNSFSGSQDKNLYGRDQNYPPPDYQKSEGNNFFPGLYPDRNRSGSSFSSPDNNEVQYTHQSYGKTMNIPPLDYQKSEENNFFPGPYPETNRSFSEPDINKTHNTYQNFSGTINNPPNKNVSTILVLGIMSVFMPFPVGLIIAIAGLVLIKKYTNKENSKENSDIAPFKVGRILCIIGLVFNSISAFMSVILPLLFSN